MNIYVVPIRHALLILLATCTLSCSSGPRSASLYGETARGEQRRSPLEAERLTLQAAVCIESDPQKAEALLREALEADLFHGPAHNNLGVIHLERGDLYEAAGEFEWARKLMPGHPDPRMNLALTLERAGHIDDAIMGYRSALEVYPGHLPTMQALTRCQLRHARADESTRELLREIALRSLEPEWRDWAQKHLAGL